MATLAVLSAALSVSAAAQSRPQGPQWLNADTSKKVNQSNFRALEEWQTPNDYRNAAGGPGPKYWQQQVDYVIRTSLDTTAHRVTGTERITYHNNSPDELTYLWFQLDQDIDRADSRAALASRALPRTIPAAARRFLFPEVAEDAGYTISRVQLVSAAGRKTDAGTFRNGTQLRVDLAAPLATGRTAVIEIDWSFVIPEQSRNGRGGREKLSDGWLYEVAQWFPRAAVYDDVNGWQNVQFYGQGEFYLEFGNYDVSITVPRDHIVRATGVLLNPLQVLTATQRSRLTRAMAGDSSVFIIRPDEIATPAIRPAGSGNLTWHFTADNVRDFAWASFRGFAWDARGFRYRPGSPTIELHSVYPREAIPLWSNVSTRAIATTMETYGRLAFEYPYPVASNVNGPVFGMEYPMIAFCGGRPRPDGTYDKSLEYTVAGVTIHEVGHNWFPMIVATDERKWTWMDEGLNSFLEYYGSLAYDPEWPKERMRGPARNLTGYMKNPSQVPLMTESDAIFSNFGNNGYSKPATSLVMLREEILGTEAFDRAFRDYSTKWMFKHPQPVDFFRSLVQGAGEQLNWFWRGMFYTTYANDQAVAGVESQDAGELTDTRTGEFYNRVTVEQHAGLIMPIHLGVTYEDGTTDLIKLPADVWRMNEKQFIYGFFSKKPVIQVVVDPNEAFIDINRDNNTWKKLTAPGAVP
ncbi:MAG: M1 family metallopeptidase [Gemmatimonadales bacterium]